jgi:2-oxoglutarate ferredoxin oxidoreductase subunit alpha
VVIRIAGDSGDGMQLTGDRFTQETASFGNDLSTLPNFPAEIRAPAGTLPGVSSFQLHFADHDILTPGDRPDVLVAMNPAALKANLVDLPKGGTIIVDTHDFTDRALARIGWTSNPLEDGTLDSFTVHAVDLTQLTLDALAGTSLSRKDAGRSKNMYALGLLSLMYSRPVEETLHFLRQKFASRPDIADANVTAFKAGWNFGETTESFAVAYEVKPAPLPAGVYRNITGNMALSYGLITAAQRAGLPLFLGAYPITPASDILHELSKHKRFGVRTFQAEDEIAGIGAAIGAAFGGSLAVTSSSGPGIALKGESIGLAVSLEIPLVVCDIQRGGPSTGLPTKTEQSDLLQAMFGRNGEAPVPIVAAQSPADCFATALEAVRILRYRTPVFLLSTDTWQTAPSLAPPERRPICRPLGAVRDRAERRRRNVPAVPSRPRHVGSTVGDSRDTRPGASVGRHRKGRPHGQHLLRPRQPRLHGSHAAGQGRRDCSHDPTADGRRPRRGCAGTGHRLGIDVRNNRRSSAPGAPGRIRHRSSAFAAPEPVPVQPRHRAGRL